MTPPPAGGGGEAPVDRVRSSEPSEDLDVEARLIYAAEEEFLSDANGLLDRVVLARVAERANVPERTARRLFSSVELRERLIEHMLHIREGVDVGPDEVAAMASLVIDRDVPFEESVGGAVNYLVDHAMANPGLKAVAALWPFAAGNPRAAELMHEMYARWRKEIQAIVNDVLVQHADVFRPRTNWMTVDDLSAAVLAIVDGLAIQRVLFDLVPETPGVPRPQPDLGGRMAVTLLLTMIQIDDDDRGPRERLEEIERRRHDRADF